MRRLNHQPKFMQPKPTQIPALSKLASVTRAKPAAKVMPAANPALSPNQSALGVPMKGKY